MENNMKLMMNGIDCGDAIDAAYRQAAKAIRLPRFEDINFSVYNRNSSVYARGGANRKGYLIKFNGNLYNRKCEGLSDDDFRKVVQTTVLHEYIHVHQAFEGLKVGHNKYFDECAAKLSLSGRHSTDESIKEKKAMKEKIGSINIDGLKKTASAMNVEFDVFCDQMGLTEIVKKAEEEQAKNAEKEELENLKMDVETFKESVEPEIERLKQLVGDEFAQRFAGSEEKLSFKFDVKFDIHIKGRKSTGGSPKGKWGLKIDGEEVKCPEAFKSVWSWLMYEILNHKNVPESTFKYGLSPGHLARKFAKMGNEWTAKLPTLEIVLTEKLGKKVEIVDLKNKEEEE
jgi:hypothetical protein